MRARGSVFFLLLALLFSVAAAYGQQTLLVTQVPFEFNVGDTTLPPGKYYIAKHNLADSLYWILDSKQRVVTSVAARPRNDKSPDAGPRVIFHRYGSRNFLAQVFLQSHQTGLEFQRGKQERELLALNKGTQVALPLVSRKR